LQLNKFNAVNTRKHS